jgi:hypothetical protein
MEKGGIIEKEDGKKIDKMNDIVSKTQSVGKHMVVSSSDHNK